MRDPLTDGSQVMRPGARLPALSRLLLLALWFAFMATALLWLPAYEGDIDRGETTFVPVYAVIAAIAAIAVRERAQSVRDAVFSVLPALAMIGVVAGCGLLLNEAEAGGRGGPLYLYVGIAVWASWIVLMFATAFVSRTKWNGAAGIGVGFLVAMLGFVLITAQID